MKRFLISRTKLALEMLPLGRDLHLHLARRRLPISYRDRFDSFREAEQAADRIINYYDVINRNKAANQAAEEAIVDNYLHDYDYPLLFWLSHLLSPAMEVLELGGSVGHFYYTSKKYFSHPEDLSWTIAELPEAVDLGEKIARKRNETRLRFIDSCRLDNCEAPALFLSAGTLQYMDFGIAKILEGLDGLPAHVLLNSVPAHPSREGWTLQYLEVCEVPYHIFSRERLLADMASLGYQLVDSWQWPRNIEIPFHSEMNIIDYSGFYWRR